jgi:DNA adenine methylase
MRISTGPAPNISNNGFKSIRSICIDRKKIPVIRPLLKWAGGKRQLLSQLQAHLPDRWGTYYEPFIGGGALLAQLASESRLTDAVIGDMNPELVNFYTVVKNKPEELLLALSKEKFRNDESSFNHLKTEFNSLIGTRKNAVERAALLIYLNKHSYNGLWRVNRKGKYNVPFGRHTNLTLPSAEALMKFSLMLNQVTIHKLDFAKVVRNAKPGDLVYFDPPYHPVSRTANFTDYTLNGFCFDDQVRLAKIFRRLSDRGVSVMLSNSKAWEIEELYHGFTIHTVEAKRFINCNGERRSGAFEIIVTNY